MGRFAKETVVPVERSRAKIEETLRKYGASEFHSGWRASAAMIGFRLGELFIRFVLPFPGRDEKRFTHKKDRYGNQVKQSDQQIARVYDQELRSRWRALLLVIKAKLEAVECQISTIEQEFMAHIVMPNQQTLGEWVIEGAMAAIKAGNMPHLALPPPKPEQPEDADFEVKQ